MVEYLATYDSDGRFVEERPRAEVHSLGLWHKSAHVYVFNRQSELVVQRRSAHKDLCPNLWDYSVGEHLLSGETFDQGATRGLREELSALAVNLTHLGSVVWRVTQLADHTDREIQQAFAARVDHELQPDPDEVAEIALVTLEDLGERMQRTPARFTPWFLEDFSMNELLLKNYVLNNSS